MTILYLNTRIHTIASKLIRGMYPSYLHCKVKLIRRQFSVLEFSSSTGSNGGPASCTFGDDLETRLAMNCRKLDSCMIRDVEVRLGTVTIAVIAGRLIRRWYGSIHVRRCSKAQEMQWDRSLCSLPNHWGPAFFITIGVCDTVNCTSLPK